MSVAVVGQHGVQPLEALPGKFVFIQPAVVVKACCLPLFQCFEQNDYARHRDVQGLRHAHHRDFDLDIAHGQGGLADPEKLSTQHQRDGLCVVDLAVVHGGFIEVRGQGLMIGIQLDRPCTELVAAALAQGLLINVTAERVVRLLPPLALIIAVLGSILGGFATPTEAASVGAVGALLLAWTRRQLKLTVLRDVVRSTMEVSSMVFLILIGASLFSLVFRGFGGDELVEELLGQLPGGVFAAVLVVMLAMFLLGFVLDFIEITFVVVPIVGPILLAMGLDPVWLGIMIAINLQTSFLTPPFGFALFYLRGVAPESIRTADIYRGVTPFIAIQLGMLGLLALWPALATWLPGIIYR